MSEEPLSFSEQEFVKKSGLIFEKDGIRSFLPVVDLYPELGDFHPEGRHAVSISAELAVELMTEAGYTLVVPETKED